MPPMRYIEEIPSNVRTITGVATAITAFVGRTLRGPTDSDPESPVMVTSFAAYERIFGDLWAESSLGFAVKDFFQNGGQQALIVRCYREGPQRSYAELVIDGLSLRAASPGAWANNLRIRVDHDVNPMPQNEPANSLFNLSIKDTPTGRIERHAGVSVSAEHPRRVDVVLRTRSALLRVNHSVPDPIPAVRPAAHIAVPAGEDAFADTLPGRYASIPVEGQGSDGQPLDRSVISDPTLEAEKRGLYALLKADLFNLLCIPPHKLSSDPDPLHRDVETFLVDEAAMFCKAHRAFLIVDPPFGSTQASIRAFHSSLTATSHAALYFPALMQPNPLHGDRSEEMAPCGAVAGVMARVDSQRGVWKAPSGAEAPLVGVPALSVALNDVEMKGLNPLGINCLRDIPGVGRVVWGARTLEGADQLASEWKYIPPRRLALFIEESLSRGIRWVALEQNDESLWERIRANVGAFLNNLFRQGAFQGATPKQAYFVRCDATTTTSNDITDGIVNILVGFAPLRPAEFYVIKIRQPVQPSIPEPS